LSKILLTGGAGFIGYFVTKELLKRGCEVVIYDAFVSYVTAGVKVPNFAGLGVPS